VVLYCSGIIAKYSRCTCIGVPKSAALSSLHVCANIFPAVSSGMCSRMPVYARFQRGQTVFHGYFNTSVKVKTTAQSLRFTWHS